jgi:hypothetical protein
MPLLSLCRATPIDLPPSLVREVVSGCRSTHEKRSYMRRACTYLRIYSASTSRISAHGATASQKISSSETPTTKSVSPSMAQKHRKATSSPFGAAGANWRPSSSTTRQGCSLSRVWTRPRRSTGSLSRYHHEIRMLASRNGLSSSTGNIRSRSRRTSGSDMVLSRRPTRKNWTGSMRL